MHHIVNWDEEYEIDTKGQEWRPGRPKWAGPLRFVRLQVRGKNISPGWRQLVRQSGQENVLRDYGLFCYLLEISAAAPREQRNCIPEIDKLAFYRDLPKEQVEEGLRNLIAAGWISSELSESSEDSAQPNRTEPNRTKPNNIALSIHKRAREAEGEDFSRWETVRKHIESEFGSDRGHAKLLSWLGNRLVSESREIIDRLCDKLESLVAESRGKDRPAAWFQTHAALAVGYPTNGTGERR